MSDSHCGEEDGQGGQLGHVEQHHVLLRLLRVGGRAGPQTGPLYHHLAGQEDYKRDHTIAGRRADAGYGLRGGIELEDAATALSLMVGDTSDA